MSELKFRTLTADEIECRVQTVVYTEKTKGCSILLYKDARCDMNILDETVGPARWQRSHELINGNLFCNVGISIPRGEFSDWVWKQDVGTESNTEKEKGQASDSFKRACVNWGIGRELYTAPFIWVDGDMIEWKDSNGKKVPKTTFDVDYIDYDDKRRISALAIRTSKGNIVWTMGTKNKVEKPKPEKKEKPQAEPKKEEPAEVLKCSWCDKVIEPRTDAKGKVWQPIDILKRYGGICPECYNQKKNESKDS